MPSTRAQCEKCGRRFRRLDTHLRVSATCRDVGKPTEHLAATPSTSMNIVPPTAISNLDATLPGNLNSVLETAAAVATPIETAPLDKHLSTTLGFKNPLRLPKSSEEWEEADYLLSSVTSSVFQASMAEEKNNCLCAGIYNILSYRFGTRAPPRPQKPRIRQHDRALKEVTRLKNKARCALRKAKREGASDDVIQPLAANFLSLLRRHSRLCRESSSRLRHKEAKDAREECNRNFWRFAKNLLGKGCTAQTPPAFTASTAHSFFSDVYQSSTHQFSSPSWMPSAPLPTPGCTMEMTPISEEELARVIRKSKPSSAPSPADRIPYLIFKKCHSLRPALLDLFNRVIMEGSVPLSWKVAVIKLIPKSSAQEDPSSPGNFRPIALTPVVSKLLSGILKDRWLRHMRANGYLDSDLQKAFLPMTPGVVEHQAKLAAVIRSARQQKRSLAVAWLDIANAYGSVHHSLIQFSLAHYHAPPEFCRLLQSWYSGLSATISTDAWSTDPVPLELGVYQGDPLSVVIFLTVMNTLSDTLCSRKDLGFTLPQSSTTINHLLYADDACIISNTPAGCQHLLDMVQHWLEWAQLKAKVPKCRSMAIQASTGKRISPTLTISGNEIPPVEDGVFKFLGMPVRVYTSNDDARSSLRGSLQQMLSVIDQTPLSRQQKLRLFKHGVCPRLSWPLMVEEFPISWLERDLQPLATKALKEWAGLARHSNTSILFLPVKRGGLALPSLVRDYKKLQASKMVQLITSHDPGVRKVADLRLLEEKKRLRMKFRPAVLVDSIKLQNHPQSRKTLTGAVKTVLSEEEDDGLHHSLCQLPAQGEMARAWEESSPDLWVRAVQQLPPEPLKFVLNASLNTLPTNSNLHMWGKKASHICPLCRVSKQTLSHVLNNCPMAMELRRYSRRHDAVLQVIGDFIKTHLPPQFSISIDSPSEVYNFPQHITPTNLRPDIVWWSDQRRELWLLELTVSYESGVADARARKAAKYHDLVEAGRAAGYGVKLLNLVVGSRGMLGDADFNLLREATDAPRKECTSVCLHITRAAILGSFSIWGSRNHAI